MRRLRHDARPRRDTRALRYRPPRRPHRRAGPRRARGGRGGSDAGLPVPGPAPDPDAHAGVRLDLRAGRAAPRGGRHDPAARARRPARPARRGGPRLPLQRRRGRGGERLGARARRHAEPRGPRLIRGDRARSGPGHLPGPRGDHQSASLVRRDPDRGRARDPRAPRAAARPLHARRGDRVHQSRPRRGVPRRPRHRGLPGALPGQEGARLGGHGRALPAGQHHAHLRDGRGGLLRLGDLLERLLLGRGRARHGDAPEQHAGRAGPEPARVPQAPTRRARAEHDGPHGGAA